jgi:hypothetical protein
MNTRETKDRLEAADRSLDWISEALHEVRHEGRSATSALMQIQIIVEEYERGRTGKES